ncbi:type II toxin-antitoxin system PemK/MazF family toxin [Alkalispirochaeta sphaeroplastigenens]|uniref:type II toxin-antitoxin system PemK/MazF family toxin n=1 Tax=Alkalispirochaeta sphaeroplastigenens TaxID=1187066 RepID=UPI001C6659AA|nr:type II toxin-antitoxin system PemK/MazF family toxin [Alkalispirochaeta sphaeroplastigenens]
MGMVISQYDVYLVDLDPTKGHEIKKTRPCVVISPNEMNKYIGTVIIAPMTSKSKQYPSRTEVFFNQKQGWIVLDQIRTIDKSRLIKRIGRIKKDEILKVKALIKEMLVD